MHKRLIAIALAGILCLSGCIWQKEAAANAVAVYRINAIEEDKDYTSVFERITYSKATGESEIETALRGLNTQSGSLMHNSFLSKCQVLGASFEDGTVKVQMSSDYARLSAAEKSLVDVCVALTFCSIDEIFYVDVLCNDTIRSKNLTVYSALLNDSSASSVSETVKLFLPGDGVLTSQTQTLSLDRGEAFYQAITEEIIAGLVSARGFDISGELHVQSVLVIEGHCTVDLSEAFFATEPADAKDAQLIIFSFVNTLCLLPDIDEVTIEVGGRRISGYGSYSPDWPLVFSYEIMK